MILYCILLTARQGGKEVVDPPKTCNAGAINTMADTEAALAVFRQVHPRNTYEMNAIIERPL